MQIVHLEDDGPLREVLKFVLTTADPTVDVHQFVRSDDAVSHIAEHPHEIDLFILDIRVPGTMDGMEVAQKIRDLGCEGAIVITSAYRRPNPALLATLGCKWMPKPWHVMDAIQKLLPLAKEQYEARMQTALKAAQSADAGPGTSDHPPLQPAAQSEPSI
jgi:DNA-binding response OmpR family regulator